MRSAFLTFPKGLPRLTRNKAMGKKVAISRSITLCLSLRKSVPRAQYLDNEWLDSLMKQQGD